MNFSKVKCLLYSASLKISETKFVKLMISMFNLFINIVIPGILFFFKEKSYNGEKKISYGTQTINIITEFPKG